MYSFVSLRLFVCNIPVILSLLFSWISCGTVQRWDDDYEKFEWTRWKKFTLPTRPTRGDYYRDSSTDDTNLKLAIFLPIGIGLFLVLIFKLFVCTDNDCCGDSSEDTSSRTVHAPPRRSNAPRSSTANLNTRQFHTPSMTGSREGLLRSSPNNFARTTPNITPGRNDGGNNNASRTNNVVTSSSDRPPDYSVVVISDLSEMDKFPEVKPSQNPDAPPPKYDDMKLPKF